MNSGNNSGIPKYDIQVLAIESDQGRSLVARHLASNPAVTLEEAQARLRHLPVWYERGMEKIAAGQEVRKLLRLKVRVRVVKQKAQEHDTAPVEREMPKRPGEAVQARQLQKPIILGAGAPGSSERGRRRFASVKPRVYWGTLGGIALVTALGITLSLVEKPEIELREIGPIVIPNGHSDSTVPSGGTVSATFDSTGSRALARAEQYLDSAGAVSGDLERMIRFYRIALSFNQKNIAAWQGLIAAYAEAGRTVDANKARVRMKKVLGDGAMPVADIIRQFGRLDSYAREPGGIMRIRYQTRERTRNSIAEEIFTISRALKPVCGCAQVTYYAQTGAGTGMVAHVNVQALARTIPEFMAQSRITYIE